LEASVSQPPGFLAHYEGDAVAVAVTDITAGPARCGYLRGPDAVDLEVLQDIPLGHKVALVDIAEGEDVLEYGVRTAIAKADIKKGEYVHVHNVRSARWQNSVA
jgi:(2R)-sulfolactate sulfo-lyase subunit alpha